MYHPPKQEGRLSDQDHLRDIFWRLFGDRCLHDNALAERREDAACQRLLNAVDGDSEAQQLASAYFDQFEAEELNENYVSSAIKLLSGQSVLISNPFYRDLTLYVMLPILRNILSYRRCLVIVSRDAATDDVKRWLDQGLKTICGTHKLWRAECLAHHAVDAEIGIWRGNDLYRYELQLIHQKFLREVGFVLILEPSHILATGQLGLSMLISRCEAPAKKVVYCAVDRNCDGLVDALSHTLKTSITEVTATLSSNGDASCMYWEADGASLHHRLDASSAIARYLGMGTELGLVALKHRPKHAGYTVRWIGSEKFPVMDMKWIAGQYYKNLCRYADIAESQAALEEKFRCTSNLWLDETMENVCLILEDEFHNLFEITRIFASRASHHAWIHVISGHYLLRDYMVDNFALFDVDAKAIPTIVPDYARTARNMVLKLLILMSHEAVDEKTILQEFEFCNISCEDASLDKDTRNPIQKTLEKLIKKYSQLDVVIEASYAESPSNKASECQYQMKPGTEIRQFLSRLQTAYFFAEDELERSHYIASRLYGHVYQAYLPGQFVTFEGKYYQVQSITQKNGVILRRAADYIHNRLYYRQIRHICLESWSQERMISVSGIERVLGTVTFEVITSGYYEMSSYHDMKNARKVIMDDIPKRRYINKTALRIRMPSISDKVRYTICVLLNEVFRTTYPDACQYVYATMPLNGLEPNQTRHLLYDMEGICDEDCFYILEDSEIDLGLIVSVERNLNRYLEIITDVLMWHNEKMGEMPCLTYPHLALLDKVRTFPTHVTRENRMVKKRGIWERFIYWLKSWFGISQNNVLSSHEVMDEVQAVPDLEILAEEPYVSGTRKTRYQRSGFIQFGYNKVDDALDVDETIQYLSRYHYDKNPFHQVRRNLDRVEAYGRTYDPCLENEPYCAFCGELLHDAAPQMDSAGRLICQKCLCSAVGHAHVSDVFHDTCHAMERLFGIKIGMPISMCYASAHAVKEWYKNNAQKDVVRRYGFIIRYVGYGEIENLSDQAAYRIYVEPNAPCLSLIRTLVHELVRAWYVSNFQGDAANEEVCGLQRWAEIRFMIHIGELAYAKRLEITTMKQHDAYTRGLSRLLTKYPLDYAGLSHASPLRDCPMS